ncbi:MAG: RDD family protein [Myxococcaceae bacterium]|nr:RDD family protein [Myxococcaceae bacterium]
MSVDLSPAQLDRRVMAGALDGVVLVALCAAYFLLPVLTLGVVLPMWGVLAAIIGYSVVPLAVFKKTIGMKMFGIELVSKSGHAVDLGNLLFRELLGRGWFPAAFLFNLVFAYVAMLMGAARFAMPAGMQALFTLASALALFVAVLGHFLVLGMKDRRSIADMMSGSWVVPQQPAPLPDDADELAERKAARARGVRNVVIAEVLILRLGLGAPWVLTRKTESTDQRAARLLRQKLEREFKDRPDSESLAGQLIASYRIAGDLEAAQRVSDEHSAARQKANEQRLEGQLRALDQNPGDEATLIAVLGELEDRDRLPEAKERYGKFLSVHPEPEYRAGFAEWLVQNGLVDEGIAEFRALVKAEPGFEGGHKFLARALVRGGQLEEAQLEYHRELVLDPSDDDAREALEELDEELGPVPKAKLTALAKELQVMKK